MSFRVDDLFPVAPEDFSRDEASRVVSFTSDKEPPPPFPPLPPLPPLLPLKDEVSALCCHPTALLRLSGNFSVFHGSWIEVLLLVVGCTMVGWDGSWYKDIAVGLRMSGKIGRWTIELRLVGSGV